MPIKKAAIKAVQQTKKRSERNRQVKNTLRTLTKNLRKALERGDTEGAKKIFAQTIKTLDKAAQNKVIKKNTAARKKSRLAKRLTTNK